jgi:hypothetical protein
MQAIRDATVVDGDFDSANHLIMTRYDATQFDAGAMNAATTALAGPVELATSAETSTGTDAVRAVTPAGLASVRLLANNALTESADITSYPPGDSVMILTTSSAWTPNSGLGMVMSSITSTDRGSQTFYSSAGGTQTPRTWTRTYHSSNGGGGWTGWTENVTLWNLTASSFTQTTTIANYPSGLSRIYYNNTNSGSWDFSGTWGEVKTYKGSDDFTRQTFTEHIGGSTNHTREWVRTCTTGSSWSAWQSVMLGDSNASAWPTYTPVWTSAGTGTPAFGNAVISCSYFKVNRKVDVRFEITFGTTTTYGNTATSDNWQFTLPVAAARSGDSLGMLELHGANNNTICIGRARTNSTTTFLIGVNSGYVGATAPTNTGDVDSVTPFTWASTNSIKGNLVYESAA